MMLSANEAREIIEKVLNDERNKVFEDIKNYAKRGAVEVGFLKLSAELASELKSLGYAVTPTEHGVVVNWAIPITYEEEQILDKPVYTDDTLTSKPVECEVLDNDSI